jgi:hypothetical protein
MTIGLVAKAVARLRVAWRICPHCRGGDAWLLPLSENRLSGCENIARNAAAGVFGDL